jgi:hypothetical protein
VTPETPLAEVAGHLGRDAANHLLQFSESVQTGVLTQVRAVVVHLEERRCALDPVTYEAVLECIVGTTATLLAEIFKLRGDAALLQSQLLGADHLIRSLGETIAQMSEGRQQP